MIALEQQKMAQDFALKWFEIHAQQRLTTFNFFLVISGFLVGGYFAATQSQNNLAAIILSAMLVLMSVCFRNLDARTRQLIHYSEDAISEMLDRIPEEVRSSKLNFIKRDEDEKLFWSYRKVFNLIFYSFIAMGVMGFINSTFWPIG